MKEFTLAILILFNPTALRMAKLYGVLAVPECNRVKGSIPILFC